MSGISIYDDGSNARRRVTAEDEDGDEVSFNSNSGSYVHVPAEGSYEEDYHVELAPEIIDTSTASINGKEEEENLTEAEVRQLLLEGDDGPPDYYTLLGLPKDPAPTDAQIRTAYHRLSLAFHPDKQPPQLKNAAEEHFTKLRRAYETLMNPQKRVICDLEGEEGVQEEYKQGGAMGPGGEAQRELSNVKVMQPKDFKKWFIGVMRGRERKALEAMVENLTSINIGLDASCNFVEMVKVVEHDGMEYHLPMERLLVHDIGVSSSFSIPLSKLGKLFEVPIPATKTLLSRTQIEEEDVSEAADWTEGLSASIPKLTITGGISGDLDQGFAVIPRGPHPKTHEPQEPLFDRFYTMTTQGLSVGAKLSHTFPEALDLPPTSLASKLQGLDIDLEANLLPHPSVFSVGLGKAISFASDIRPFYMQTRFICRDSPLNLPPEVQVTLTRQLGMKADKTAFLMWHSGEYAYPVSWAEWMGLDLNFVARWLTSGKSAPVVRTGMFFRHAYDGNIIDEGAETLLEELPGNSSSSSVALTASKNQLALELKHSFDLFSKFDEPPIRSRIRNSGEAADDNPTICGLRKSRGMRVEATAALSLPIGVDLSLLGKRRVGTFTTLGFGIGLNPQAGLHFDLSWQRLGQSVQLPVAILPLDELTTSRLVMAVGLPWATYATFEFLYLRPREKSRRQRLIKAQRKKLRSKIAARREEAAQAVELLLPSVAIRQHHEMERGGLVIVSATYGTKEKNGEWKGASDVTVALAALVDDGQLSLARRLDKSRLIGFWDPAPLERKVLEVRYLFEGKEHKVKVRGGQGLVLPRREHEL